jgi:hypothetical protein
VDKLCQYTTGVESAASLCKRHAFRQSRVQSHWSDSIIHMAHALTDVANWPRVQATAQVESHLPPLLPKLQELQQSSSLCSGWTWDTPCLSMLSTAAERMHWVIMQMTLALAGAVTSRATLKRVRPRLGSQLLPRLPTGVAVPAPRALVNRTLQRRPIAMATAVAASYTAGRAPMVGIQSSL